MRSCVACGRTDVDGEWRCQDCGFAPAIVDGFTSFAPELSEEAPGFRAEDFEGLADLEPDSAWFLSRNRLIAWALSYYFSTATRIHEVGCGTGFVLTAIRAAMPGADVSGSEVLVRGLKHAARRVPTAALYQADATRLPFRGAFDVVGAFDVLEHIDDDGRALAEIHASLMPHGGLILTVPQHPRLWSHQDDLAHHVRRYTARGLEGRVLEAGFDIVRSTSFVSLLLPALWLARKRGNVGRTSGTDALRRPPIVERTMGLVLAVERAAIRAGVSLPIGGSRLIVARRRD